MIEMNASTILDMLLKTYETNWEDHYDVMKAQDMLMLIGPNTDVPLLLRGLKANKEKIDNDIYQSILKYALFHYPEEAKKFLLEVIDMDVMSRLLTDLGIQHAKSKKKITGYTKNLIDREIAPEVQAIMDKYLVGVKRLFAAHPGMIIIEFSYGGLFPDMVMDYVQNECKDLFTPRYQLVALNRATPEQEFVDKFHAAVDNIKEIVTPINTDYTDTKKKKTFQFGVNFYVHMSRLGYETVPEFTNLPAKLKDVVTNVNGIKMTLKVKAVLDGRVEEVNLSKPEYTFKPKGTKFWDSVCDPASRSWYSNTSKFCTQQEASTYVAMLWPLKQKIETLFRAKLDALLPDLESVWKHKVITVWTFPGTDYNGEKTEGTVSKLIQEIAQYIAEYETKNSTPAKVGSEAPTPESQA